MGKWGWWFGVLCLGWGVGLVFLGFQILLFFFFFFFFVFFFMWHKRTVSRISVFEKDPAVIDDNHTLRGRSAVQCEWTACAAASPRPNTIVGRHHAHL